MEIGRRLFAEVARDRAGDPHLPFELAPEEQQARARVGARSRPLRAVVVGVEDEAVLVDALEQHGARRRLAGGDAVASVIALTSSSWACSASSNQCVNWPIGSAARVPFGRARGSR